MRLFARIAGGLAIQPEQNNSAAEYMARFDGAVIAAWGANPVIVQVCAGVQHDARYLGGDFLDPAQYLNPDGTDGNGVSPEQEPAP